MELVHAGQIDDIDHPLLTRHLRSIAELGGRFAADRPADPFERALHDAVGPAVVISSAGTVAALNEDAARQWQVRRGYQTELDWIHPSSLEDLRNVQRSAARGGNRQHAVLRVLGTGEDGALAEAFVLESGQSSGLVAIRALQFVWNRELSEILDEAFSLTEAEIAICRLLLDLRDTARMARRRQTSVRTIRTQLQTIFAKTETGSQVDLIRLLALLSARAGQRKRSARAGWQDPLGNETIIAGPDGRRIAFSWTGNPAGRPVLLSHGMATGYLLPLEQRETLAAQGIKLYLLNRPGFGNSEPADGVDSIEAGARAVCAVAQHLKIESWPAIGLAGGAVPLIRAAANSGSRISAILAVATHSPFNDEENFSHLPQRSKVVMNLSRRSSLMAKISAQNFYLMIETRGVEFLMQEVFGDNEPDRRALRDPDCRALVQTARSMLYNYREVPLAGEFEIMASDWSADLSQCPVSLHFLFGESSPTHTVNQIATLKRIAPNAGIEQVPEAGKLMVFTHGDLIVRRLLEIMEDR